MNKKGIHLIEPLHENNDSKMQFRDAYYHVVEMINQQKHLGHAICLVGLRRTGKSVLLNQLHLNSEDFNIQYDEVLHITLSGVLDDKDVSRDNIDKNKIKHLEKIIFPSLEDIKQFIDDIRATKKIKCIMIDEVTLCKDLVLNGKGFVDSIVDNNIILILAGTESASFNTASKNSLYSRLILEDISYIPLGEYCRLKGLSVKTLEDKQQALKKYLEHGNILDDTVDVDDKYIESALGVNVALSIINSDYEEFIGCEHNIKELVQSIVKYFRLLGEQLGVERIKAEITRADLTKPLSNLNRRLARQGYNQINIPANDRTQLIIKAAEKIFSEYDLEFGISKVPLSNEQLSKIDELFTEMGLIYDLSIIPEYSESNGAVDADDLNILHSLTYNFLNGIADKVLSSNLGLSYHEAETLADEVKSTAEGNLIEGIITLQFTKGFEKNKRLLSCLKNYKGTGFQTVRRCTKHNMYKYNNKIIENDSVVNAEIDLVIPQADAINLVEIKKRTVYDAHQTRWLNNQTVQTELKALISDVLPMKKYVLYLGKPMQIEDVEYKNIVDVLLEHYDKYLRTR